MRYYPIFLNLAEVDVLVAGAGQVGRRKVASLLPANPASLLWVDPGVAELEIQDFLLRCGCQGCIEYDKLVTYAQRTVCLDDLIGKGLVFACTDNKDVNAEIASFCKERAVLCNIVDAPECGGFIVPAQATYGDIQVALGTSGKSPALAAAMRDELLRDFLPTYSKIAGLSGALRPLVLELGLPAAQRSAIFRELTGERLACALREGDRGRAVEALEAMLPRALHSRVKDILDDYF